MKRFNWLLIGLVVLCLAVVVLAGCVSKSEFEALQGEYTALLQEKASLIQENSSLKGKVEELQSDLTSARADYDMLKVDHNKLSTDYDKLSTDYDKLNDDYEKLGADYEKLTADYEATNNKLAEIEEFYPPTYFDDYNELESWVNKHVRGDLGTDVFRQHLELQKKALANGYIWSVHTEPDGSGIISSVVAGDSVYYVWLDGYIEWACWK